MIANGERDKQHCKQLNGQVLNEHQMRLFTLLKKILEVPFCKSRQTYIVFVN